MKHIFGIKAQIWPLKLGGQKTNLWFATAQPGQKNWHRSKNRPELPHDCLFWWLLALFFLNFDGPIHMVARVDTLTRPGGVVDTQIILSFYAFLFYLRKDQAITFHITYDQRQSSTCAIAIAATRASGGTGADFATRLDSCQPWEIVDTQALCHMKNLEDWNWNSNVHTTLTKTGSSSSTQCTSQKSWPFCTHHCGVHP